MKLLKLIAGVILATVSLFMVEAQAATPGFYLGAQAGTGKADEGDEIKQSIQRYPNNKSSEGGFTGRLFAGYNFNRYVGIETGYTKFANNNYDATSKYIGTNLSLKTTAWDFVGKGYLPLDVLTDSITENLNIYAKLGFAYLDHKYEYKATVPGHPIDTESDTQSIVRPTYTLGVGYDVTKNFTVDVSWTRIQGKGKLTTDGFKNFAPETNMLALGLAYTFS